MNRKQAQQSAAKRMHAELRLHFGPHTELPFAIAKVFTDTLMLEFTEWFDRRCPHRQYEHIAKAVCVLVYGDCLHTEKTKAKRTRPRTA